MCGPIFGDTVPGIYAKRERVAERQCPSCDALLGEVHDHSEFKQMNWIVTPSEYLFGVCSSCRLEWRLEGDQLFQIAVGCCLRQTRQIPAGSEV